MQEMCNQVSIIVSYISTSRWSFRLALLDLTAGG